MYNKLEAKSIMLVVALLFVTVYLPMVPSTTADSFDGVSWLKYADDNGAIPVVDVGDPSHQDNTWVGGPSVIIDNDAPVNERYKMWHYGADTRDFHGIGTFYATSLDGILWIKYTDSSGAAVPVLEPGPSGSYDEDRAMVGTVIKEGSIYKMWYSGIDGSNKARTLYATSSDGISWTKQGVVLDIGASGERDDTYAYSPRVITDLNAPQAEKYKMWYTGKGSGTGGQYKAFYAVSPDGLSWTKYSDSSGAIVVIDSGGLPSGLDDKIAVIHSIFLEEMIYKAWYTGYDSIGIARIFYTESIDGKSWYKHGLALDVGSPGDLDDYSIHLPCVLKDETGTYHMWYEGVHIESAGTVRRIFYAHSNILENLPPVANAGPDLILNEGDVVWLDGSNSKVSTNCSGQAWTKYAGNPVLDLGPSGSWDDYRVYAPTVIHDSGTYHMWYIGDDGLKRRIGYATSTDGIAWTKYPSNPVLTPGPSSWDRLNVGHPTVLFDGTTFHMWYSGTDGSHLRIGHATSPDGTTWIKHPSNPVFNLGPSGSWDDHWVCQPNVLYDGVQYHMWYNGHDGTTYRIGYANSVDRITWTRHPTNPVIDSGVPGSWEDLHVIAPTVHYDGTIFSMWYGGRNNLNARTGYATSPNGFIWTKSPANPVLDLGPPGSWDDTHVQAPTVFYDGSTYRMWYSGHDGSNFRIGFAYSSTCSGSKIVKYEWDFESDGVYDYQETSAFAPDGDYDGKTMHVYGDDGIYTVTLRVTDSQNLTATDTCNITVLNAEPTVTIESVSMDVEIGLRVAGRKYNDVGMTLYEDDDPIGYVSIERLPGSPNEQIAWIPVSIDFLKPYTASVTYTPEDPPNIGANPVWIYIKSKNGSVNKIHHTFNVQQSKKRDSDHWNHVEPWEVDLSAHFIGLSFEVTSHVIDPGSDDEILTYTYGSQIVNVTYLNNPPIPDPNPSPEINPVDIYDTTFLTYEGPGTIFLTVTDDDGGAVSQVINLQ